MLMQTSLGPASKHQHQQQSCGLGSKEGGWQHANGYEGEGTEESEEKDERDFCETSWSLTFQWRGRRSNRSTQSAMGSGV